MRRTQLISKAKKIKLLVLDVDGILTDGRIVLDHRGQELKQFNVKDGFGVVLLRRAGLKAAILSARSAPAVTARAKDLGFDKIYQDASPKSRAYGAMLKEFALRDDQVCFMGDDLPDLEVLGKVGLAVTVPNAVDEVKKRAHHITKSSGGEGAVREVVELILKAQNLWETVLLKY